MRQTRLERSCPGEVRAMQEWRHWWSAVCRAGGPYAAPEELVDRCHAAAIRVWAERGVRRG